MTWHSNHQNESMHKTTRQSAVFLDELSVTYGFLATTGFISTCNHHLVIALRKHEIRVTDLTGNYVQKEVANNNNSRPQKLVKSKAAAK